MLATLLHSQRGKLILGIPPVTVTVIHSLLHQYQQMYPEITLQITEIGAQTVFSLIQAGAVDIGIIIEPFDHPEVNKIPIMESEAVCVVSTSHRLANYDTVSFSQLKDEPFFRSTNLSCFTTAWWNLARKPDSRLRFKWRAHNGTYW